MNCTAYFRHSPTLTAVTIINCIYLSSQLALVLMMSLDSGRGGQTVCEEEDHDH